MMETIKLHRGKRWQSPAVVRMSPNTRAKERAGVSSCYLPPNALVPRCVIPASKDSVMNTGGQYWARTSDLLLVRQAL